MDAQQPEQHVTTKPNALPGPTPCETALAKHVYPDMSVDTVPDAESR